jgi:hypothetical protein
MTIAAVKLGLLGLPRGVFSGPAAVVWNSVYIVAACGGGTPGGLVKKTRIEKLPDPSINFKIRCELGRPNSHEV